jgi:hypothetical protein
MNIDTYINIAGYLLLFFFLLFLYGWCKICWMSVKLLRHNFDTVSKLEREQKQQQKQKRKIK